MSFHWFAQCISRYEISLILLWMNLHWGTVKSSGFECAPSTLILKLNQTLNVIRYQKIIMRQLSEISQIYSSFPQSCVRLTHAHTYTHSETHVCVYNYMISNCKPVIHTYLYICVEQHCVCNFPAFKLHEMGKNIIIIIKRETKNFIINAINGSIVCAHRWQVFCFCLNAGRKSGKLQNLIKYSWWNLRYSYRVNMSL